LLDCEIVHAFIAGELRRTDEARTAYQSILTAATRIPSTDHEVYRQLALGELALARTDLGAAEVAFRKVVQTRGKSDLWWERQQALQAELGLGNVALAEHKPLLAREHLEAAAVGYTEIAQTNPGLQFVRRADDARQLLASFPERAHAALH